MVVLFLLGFSSGLPRLLVYGTLTFWLLDEGLSIAAVGLFAATSTPYSVKFVWAPVLDRLRLGLLSAWLGQRRSWMLVTQLGLVGAIAALAMSDPAAQPVHTALLAILVAFFSASQDVVVDAYRVELLEPQEQGAGAASAVFGYRIAMLAAGAGALYFATWSGDWHQTYLLMAALMAVGLMTTLLCAEPKRPPRAPSTLVQSFDDAVLGPFRNLTARTGWLQVLVFVALFKVGEALAAAMLNPFLVELSFSKVEIANIAKTYGLVASIVGFLVGGAIVRGVGVIWGLWLGGVLQMASNLVFVYQAHAGYDLWALTATIGVENLTGGIGTAAFVAYLSALCDRHYTATQYALFTALAGLATTLLSGVSGVLAVSMGWPTYFVFTAVAALPGLFMLHVITSRQATGLMG
ncbi:MAG: AmpG family muropeptide MFS transporter [Bradymonadaceae bacterium]|nr:AmpG family muropeptide MFS transporter [Lujinxingiaceae bacterium]